MRNYDGCEEDADDDGDDDGDGDVGETMNAENTGPNACVAGNGMKNNSIIFHEQFAKILWLSHDERRLIGDGNSSDDDDDGGGDDVGRAENSQR